MDQMNKIKFVWTQAWSLNVLGPCKAGHPLAVSRAGTRDVASLQTIKGTLESQTGFE